MRDLRSGMAAVLLLVLTACGGGGPEPAGTVPRAKQAMQARMARPAPAVIVMTGVASDYTITRLATDVQLKHKSSGVIRNVPADVRLRFDDCTLALDIEGNAGQAYRLYQAAFNRVPDIAGLSYWIAVLDSGTSLENVATGFAASNEFRSIYGSATDNESTVRRFYQNVLHRDPDATGLAYWTDALNRGVVTMPVALTMISESPENQLGVMNAIVDGITTVEAGVDYAPVARAQAPAGITLGKITTLSADGSSASLNRSLSYRWTMQAKPTGSRAVLVMGATASPSFVPDLEGEYLFELVVNDGSRDSVASQLSIFAGWQPPEGAVPATGNYVYMSSTSGDYVGAGLTHLYTQANAAIGFRDNGWNMQVNVSGDEWWNGMFAFPSATGRGGKVARGFYPNAARFGGATTAGLDWGGDGRGCNQVSGWIYVSTAEYEGDVLRRLELTFRQHCEGGTSSLYGKVRLGYPDNTQAPGPTAAPGGLWTPPAGALPANGNAVYINSPYGDWIGGGYQGTTVDSSATPLRLNSTGANLSWSTSNFDFAFKGMNSISQIEKGYYAGLQRYAFSNALKGGLSIGSPGRGCNTSLGWVMVDDVVYVNGALNSILMRFEQSCDGQPPLRGVLRWKAT